MTPLRVLFAGTPEVALPALDHLLGDDRFEVVGVLTNPDRPRGRSGRPEPTPIARRAREQGLPVLQPMRPGDAVQEMVETGAQIGAVVAYGGLLPDRVLEALPLGFLNLHFSLLPRWRGAAPVQWAIRSGDDVTGLSVFRLDEGMDTGPLLRSAERPIPADMDAGDLLDVLALEGAPLLAEGLLALAAGEQPQPQSREGITLAPKLTSSDGEVDWAQPAVDVARMIRSVSPRPGASTSLEGGRIKLAGVRVSQDDVAAAPGTLLATAGGIAVACGRGTVVVERVQFPGRPWASTEDQVRGRRLAPGMVLGAAVPSL